MTRLLLKVKIDIYKIDERQTKIYVRQIAESLLKTYAHCFLAFIVEKCKVWPAIIIIIVRIIVRQVPSFVTLWITSRGK